MADFSAIKTEIQTNIKTNGNQEITGVVLRDTLIDIVDATGENITELESLKGVPSVIGKDVLKLGYKYAGMAPDENGFLVAKDNRYTFIVPVTPNTQYSIRSITGVDTSIWALDKNKFPIVALATNFTAGTLTTPEGAKYLLLPQTTSYNESIMFCIAQENKEGVVDTLQYKVSDELVTDNNHLIPTFSSVKKSIDDRLQNYSSNDRVKFLQANGAIEGLDIGSLATRYEATRINEYGKFIDSEDYTLFLLPATPNTRYSIRCLTGMYSALWAFDEDMNPIAAISDANFSVGEVETPNKTTYIGLPTYNTSVGIICTALTSAAGYIPKDQKEDGYVSLTEENSLYLIYQMRNIQENPYNPSIEVRFDGVLTIRNDKNGNVMSYTIEDIKSMFPDAVEYNTFNVFYNRRLSFKKSTSELVLKRSTDGIDADELILLENWVYDIETTEYKNNIRGELANIFYRKMSSLYNWQQYTDYPDYLYHSGIENRLNELANVIDVDDELFLITTDAHSTPYLKTILSHDITYGIVNYLAKKLNVRFHLNLGDSIYQTPWLLNKTTGLSNLRDSMVLVNNTQHFFAVGNHDYNSMPGQVPNSRFFFTDKEMYNALGRSMNGNVVWGSKEKLYYYKDFEDMRVRMIVLNTTDNYVEFDAEGNMTTPDPMNYPTIRQEQITWLANTALVLDKQDKEQWHTIVFCHISTSPAADGSNAPNPINRTIVHGVLKAFQNGTSYEGSSTDENDHASVSINVDYSNQGAMNLIGVVSGHTHATKNYDYDGITYRALHNAYINSGEVSEAYKSDYCVALCAVNTKTQTFKVWYIGYGGEFSFNW